MRKKRIDTHVTLDTQVIVNNRRESIFRHLENGSLRLIMVLNYNGRNGFVAYVADIIESPGLHWRITKESYLRYIERAKHFDPSYTPVSIDYFHWTGLE